MKYKVKKGCQVVHLKENRIYGAGEELEVSSPHDVDRPHYLVEFTTPPIITGEKKFIKRGRKKPAEE